MRGADDDRVEARLGRLAGLRLRRRPVVRPSRERSASSRASCARLHDRASAARRRDPLDVGVEAEARAGALGFLAQQVRELAAVADLVVLRVDAGVQRVAGLRPGSIARQRGGVERLRRGAELGEGASAGLGERQVSRALRSRTRKPCARSKSRCSRASAACSRSRLKWARRCMRARLAR